MLWEIILLKEILRILNLLVQIMATNKLKASFQESKLHLVNQSSIDDGLDMNSIAQITVGCEPTTWVSMVLYLFSLSESYCQDRVPIAS